MNQTPFFFYIKGKFTPLDPGIIVLIEANRNYSNIHTKDHKFTIIGQLHSLERKLPPQLFCRIHRQYIISIKHISYVTRQYVGIGDKDIPLSEKYYQELMAKLNVFRGC